MNLHELKIWCDGFQAALKDSQPNKEQWMAVLEKIMASEDTSTKNQKLPSLIKE